MRMQDNHWTDDDLLLRLYGADAAPQLSAAHLTECPACAARWEALASSRAAMLASSPMPDQFEQRLRAQRMAMWQRLERPSRSKVWRAVPAAATVFMMFVGIALHQPAPQPVPQQVASSSTISDEQLFSEIASVINQDAPRAADPMRALFSEASNAEVQ